MSGQTKEDLFDIATIFRGSRTGYQDEVFIVQDLGMMLDEDGAPTNRQAAFDPFRRCTSTAIEWEQHKRRVVSGGGGHGRIPGGQASPGFPQ
jgi:hypothetical protein